MPLDAAKLAITETPGGIRLTVKVVPGASRTKLVGLWGTALRIAVSAPPERGKANEAVIKLLAEVLAVKRADVTIVAGHAQSLKQVVAQGLTPPQARARVAALG